MQRPSARGLACKGWRARVGVQGLACKGWRVAVEQSSRGRMHRTCMHMQSGHVCICRAWRAGLEEAGGTGHVCICRAAGRA